MKKKTVLMTCLTMTLLSQTMVCKAAASPLLKVQTAQQDSKTPRLFLKFLVKSSTIMVNRLLVPVSLLKVHPMDL